MQAAAAVTAAALITSKVLEAVRCKKVNKTMKVAQLPSVDTEDNGEPDTVVKDPTGAMARALRRPDGVELYVRKWAVAEGSQPRGLVVLVHGFMWHSRYFQPLAERLSVEGFVVVTYDLRGHGLSGLEDGLPGHTCNFSRHTGDLLAVLQFAAGRHAGLPLFVYAESFGGPIVLSTLAKKHENAVVRSVRGYILSGPALRPQGKLMPPAAVQQALRGVATVFPKAIVPGQKIAESFDLAFPDTATADKYRGDPLVLFPPRLAMAASFIASEARRYRDAVALPQPHLVLLASNDSRVDVDMIESLQADSVAEDKQLQRIEGGYHQLLQDKEEIVQETMDEIVSWLTQRAQ